MKNRIVPGKLFPLIFSCLLSPIFFQTESKATLFLFNPPPLNPTNFIQQSSGEIVTTINDTSGFISTLQAAIDTANNARTNPSNFILINLKPGATYQVTNNPLTLGSKMCLSGASNTSIAASPSATATSLIKITNGSSFTSVNFLTLNGNQAPLYGIEATGVNRVNLDQLIIRKTGKDGIFMQGLGAGTFDNEVTVTRCEVSEASTAAGIHLSDTTQAACLDNLCYNNAYGILLESSAHAALVNNQAKFNTASGISLTNSSSNKITRNFCQGNGAGLSIAGGTNSNQRNFFVLNEILSSPTGISLGGLANVLYDNLISSNVTSRLVLRTGYEAGTNRIISTASSFSNTGTQEYFYPPTINNPHSEAIIRNGKGRTNIVTSAMTLSEVQNIYNAAHTNNTNVIVLKLTAPEITGDATLYLTSNTCVLIDGIIKLNPGVTAFSSLSNSYISISGGTIDGQNSTQPRNGLVFSNCSRILIKKMSLINFGSKNTRTNSDVIAFKGNGNPSIVSDCTINGGSGRGIWTLGNNGGSASGFIFNSNSISNVNMDGIDLDMTTSASLAIDNTCSDNLRYGIFTEESANLNHVIRNLCTSNNIGLNVYSYDVGPTSYNSFIANACQANLKGLRTGGTGKTSTRTNNNIVSTITNQTDHNFFFDNVVRQTPESSNSSDAAICAQAYGSENYFTQNFLVSNQKDYSDTNTAVFFNSPYSTATLTTSLGYLDWQESFGWSASASLPDADPNGNGVPNLLEYALALDPLSTTPPALPLVGWDTGRPNGPWLTFSYRHNKSATDLTYEIWSSTDLKNWTLQNADGATVIAETVNLDADGDGKTELLRTRNKVDPTETKRFYKLGIRKN
jgi:parallel beta-helix repeat protein